MWRCAGSDSPGRPVTSMVFDPEAGPERRRRRRRGRLDTGKRAQALEQRAVDLRSPRHVGRERARRHDAEHQQTLVIETDRQRCQPDEGLAEQGCAGEQDHGQRHLAGHDDALRAAAEPRQASARSQRVKRRAGRTQERRHGAAEDRRRAGDDRRKDQDAKIDPDGRDPRQTRRCQCHERGHEPPRREETRHSTGNLPRPLDANRDRGVGLESGYWVFFPAI